jgi:Uma2 family endonuclease
LNDEARRKNLNYKVTDRIAIATKKADGTEQGRHPDVSVVSLDVWRSNPLASSGLREPLALAVEVVSTNWEDDYVDKLSEYQRLGIKEYWIVDYLAIGPRSYLGNPKVPTVFVYHLVGGEYQVQVFTGSRRIISHTFTELQLTVEEILKQA